MSILEARYIFKHYDGVQALSDVSVAFEPGEVHALMGENGAGKSTLGKIVAGVVRPSSGDVLLDGKPIEIDQPMQAQKLGIGMIFQELDLFPSLTVGENIAVGNLALASGPFVDFRKLEQQVRPFLSQVELHVRSDMVLGELSMAQQQLVAIARALSMNARLIVMDEPTSSLTEDAVSRLFGLIRKLTKQGVAIVYVSHKMDEIFQIADRVTVLRDGRHMGTKLCVDTNVNELIRMMVGREVSSQRRRVELSAKSVLLSVRNVTTRKLTNVSFDLHASEVLGVAGLVGAGRSELGEALFGLDPIIAGTVTKSGQNIRPTSPRVAMRHGIGLLPEDRKLQGLMMQMSVRENASIATLHQVQSSGFIRSREEASRVASVHQRTRIKAASPQVAISTLSGGNQQKVLLARWLLVDPDVLILDDPTRGVDIGAKFDIYELIAEVATAGKGVILVSSELPELLHCCDRIMVLREGRLAGIRDTSSTSQEELMSLASVADV